MEDPALLRQQRIQKATGIISHPTFKVYPESKQVNTIRILLSKGLLYGDLRTILRDVNPGLLVQFPDLLSAQRQPVTQEVAREETSLLCARLLTRALNELTAEEREFVLNYLYSIGIDVKRDLRSRDICLTLLEKLMVDEFGNKVPVTAYANNLLLKAERERELRLAEELRREEEKVRLEEELRLQRLREKEEEEERKERTLRSRKLNQDRDIRERDLRRMADTQQTCVRPTVKILSVLPYMLVVDEQVAVAGVDEDGQATHYAGVHVPQKVFETISQLGLNPLLEIVTTQGRRAYVRIYDFFVPEDEDELTVHISPQTARVLGLEGGRSVSAVMRLCSSIPELASVDFVYYGTQAELDRVGIALADALSNLITLNSYVSLGMVFEVPIREESGDVTMHKVRVEQIFNAERELVFAGVIPLGDFVIDLDGHIIADE